MVSSGRGQNIKTRKIASDLSGLENERKQGGAIGFTIGLTLKIGQTRVLTRLIWTFKSGQEGLSCHLFHSRKVLFVIHNDEALKITKRKNIAKASVSFKVLVKHQHRFGFEEGEEYTLQLDKSMQQHFDKSIQHFWQFHATFLTIPYNITTNPSKLVQNSTLPHR